MSSASIAMALEALRPGAQWVLYGGDLSTLQWLDQTQARPTNDDILSEIMAQGD